MLANNYLLSNKKGDIKPDFTKIINNEKIEKSDFFNFTYISSFNNRIFRIYEILYMIIIIYFNIYINNKIFFIINI